MTRLEKITQDVSTLSEEELRKFREWFAEFESELWDRQIERDVLAGKLDAFAEEALAEHRAGRTKPL